MHKFSQKVILENRVFYELKLSKNVNNKICAPKLIFLNEKKKLRKIRIIFEIENTSKVQDSDLVSFGILVVFMASDLQGNARVWYFL